jgi:hypothetical protein
LLLTFVKEVTTISTLKSATDFKKGASHEKDHLRRHNRHHVHWHNVVRGRSVKQEAQGHGERRPEGQLRVLPQESRKSQRGQGLRKVQEWQILQGQRLPLEAGFHQLPLPLAGEGRDGVKSGFHHHYKNKPIIGLTDL